MPRAKRGLKAFPIALSKASFFALQRAVGKAPPSMIPQKPERPNSPLFCEKNHRNSKSLFPQKLLLAPAPSFAYDEYHLDAGPAVVPPAGVHRGNVWRKTAQTARATWHLARHNFHHHENQPSYAARHRGRTLSPTSWRRFQ